MESKKKLSILIFIFLFSIIGIVLLPNSFSALQPIKSVEMFSKNTDFTKKEAGAWKVTKSAKWLGKGEAEITVDVDSIMKTGNKYSDVLLVVDNSQMLEGEKFTKVKEATTELVNNLLVNGENRVGLITFNSSSEIVSDFTNDIVNLTEKINDLSTTGSTSYYRALENVDKILKEYQREENRECKVLFITTTNPSLDIPNEVAYYEYLKKQYPFITINGIQYEMGNIVIDSIRRITDNQYLVNSENLNNVLLEVASSSISYDKFIITDYIDTNYFNVESESSISVNQGDITLDKDSQTISWNLDNFKSGDKVKMTVKASLKAGLTSGVYPTSTKTHIESKIGDQSEDEDNTNTPILANNYRVIYDGSAPTDCSVEDLPEAESKQVLETVGISDVIPKCEGYQFKGWKLITKDVSKINDDYFIMPEGNVVFKATWGKVAVKKLMDGKISSASSDLEKGDIILDLGNNQTETLDVSEITNMATEVADENIASISAEGIITGKNIGNTTITVRGDNDYLKEYKVSVQKTVTVTYEKQGIGVTGITKEKDSCLITKSGESCKVVAPKMTVLPGYEVAGWNTDMNSREGVKSGDIISLSEDATYYSIFYKEAATYSVNFNANGNAISDTKKSCSIDRVYNGSTEGINCSITTPVITAPSATPTIVGYNEDKSETDSQIGSGETLVLNETNTGKTYYAITRKDEIVRNITYTKGKGVSATGKASDSCTIPATYNGEVQTATSCSVTIPSITTGVGYQEAGYYTNTGGTGTKYAASSSYTLSDDVTLYAVAKRNFTCAAAGSTTSYAGKNWYTVANDGTNCTLALNTISSSTGTYAEATSKLTSEYFTSGTTLLAEKNAGLTSVLGTRTDKTGLTGSGIIWTSSTTALPINKTFTVYSNSTGTGYFKASTHMTPNLTSNWTTYNMVTAYNTSTTSSCSSISGSSCIVNNTSITKTTVTDHGSKSYSLFTFYSSSEGSSTSFRMNKLNQPSGTTATPAQYSLYLRPCGGSYHGQNLYRLLAVNATTAHYKNYNTGTDQNISKATAHKFYLAATAASTTSTVTNGTQRIYTFSEDPSCIPGYTYTYANSTYPINYRLYVRVKM